MPSCSTTNGLLGTWVPRGIVYRDRPLILTTISLKSFQFCWGYDEKPFERAHLIETYRWLLHSVTPNRCVFCRLQTGKGTQKNMTEHRNKIIKLKKSHEGKLTIAGRTSRLVVRYFLALITHNTSIGFNCFPFGCLNFEMMLERRAAN